MRQRFFASSFIGLLVLAAARVTAAADVCVVVDETHDTFSPDERTASLLLLGRQFELAGERVVPAPCPDQFVVSHVQLGRTISIALAGRGGRREATALGLDDVPAVYSQMVRSLLAGRPLSGMSAVDRTNVSETQAAPLRVGSDSVFYARLGYGAIFGDRAYGVPSVGLIGYRHELDSFGVDVSFLNFQLKPSSGYGAYGAGEPSGWSGSWLKLEGLYFKRPLANQTPYFGGGLSWGGTSLQNGSRFWDGSGLQGELTAGYELARASTIRLFVQADAGLPFYNLTSTTYTSPTTSPARPIVVTSHQYAPSLTLSIGLGWQRGGRTRQ